jgi:hypothetical protein
MEIYLKLDFENNVWDSIPHIRWTVDVWDGQVIVPTDTFTVLMWAEAMTLSIENYLVPTEYALYQNYPNPFNPVTRINYDLPYSGTIRLTVYNLLGREVTTLVNDHQEPGRYSLIWNGQDHYNRMVSSGVYFYHLSTPEYNKTKKMILLK